MRGLIILALLSLAACGQPETGYPPGYEMTFMNACEARSDVEGLCACVWDKIEAEVPRADFEALERLPGPAREASPLTQQINNYAYACGSSGQGEPTPAP